MATGRSFLISTLDTTPNNGCPITRYEVRWDTNRDMTTATYFVGPMRQVKQKDTSLPKKYEYSATGFDRRGPYYFSVRGISSAGAGDWSDASDSVILKITNPARMSAPTLVEADSAHSLVLSYVPSADLGMKMGGRITEYEFRFTRWRDLLADAEAGVVGDLATGDPAEKVHLYRWEAPPHGVPPPVRVPNLDTGRSYAFQVRGISPYGEGPWSDTSEPFRTLPSVPEKPTAIDVSAGTNSPFSANFQMHLPESNGSPVKQIRLRYLGPNWKNRPEVTEWKDLKMVIFDDCEIGQIPREGENVEFYTEPFITTWEYSVLHLEPGANYRFMFSCINDVGESELSEPSGLISTLPTLPDKCTTPFLQSHEDQTPTTITFYWNPPHDGGSDIKCYTILWSSNSRFVGHRTVENVKEACYTIEDLQPNQKYYVKVAAINQTGQGKFSDLVIHKGLGCFSTIPRVPGPARDVVAEVLKDLPGAAKITWGKPFDDGGCTVSRYKVLYSIHEDFLNAQEQVQKAFRECRFTDLQPDTTYYFDVRAVNSVGAGPLTGIKTSVKTLPIPPQKFIPPATPELPEVQMITDQNTGEAILVANWSVNENYDKKLGFIYDKDRQTHMVLHHSIEVQGGYPSPENIQHKDERHEIPQVRDRRTVPKNALNVAKFGSLIPGRYYRARVKAFSEAGSSDWSEWSEVVRAPPGCPDQISNVSCIGTTKTTVEAEWESPNGNGEAITHFYLRYQEVRVLRGWENGMPLPPGEGGPLAGQYEELQKWSDQVEVRLERSPRSKRASTVSLSGGTHKYTISNLQPASYYLVEVTAANAVGCGTAVESMLMKTRSTEPGPPGPCFGVPGQATSRSVTFEWQAPEYLGGEVLLGYEVRWMQLPQMSRLPKSKNALLADEEGIAHVVLGPETTSHTATGIHPGDFVVPIVRCHTTLGSSEWARLPAGGKEVIALSSKPEVPAVIDEPPVMVETSPIDRRPYSIAVSWKVPECMGRPIRKCTLRIYRADVNEEGTTLSEPCGTKLAKDEILEYTLEKPRERDWQKGEVLSLTDLHQGMVPGVPYRCHIRATNEVGDAEGWGPWSNSMLGPADLPAKPEAPTSLWQWPNAIETKWVEPWMKGAILLGVQMRYSMRPDLSEHIQVSDENAHELLDKNEIHVHGLAFATCYFFAIRVRNQVGWSEWSFPSAGYMTGACRPAPPLMPELQDIDMESVRFQWLPPNDHGAPILKYDLILVDRQRVEGFRDLLQRINDAGVECEEANMELIEALPPKEVRIMAVEEFADPLLPDHMFEELLGGLNYAIAIRAHNKEGPSDWSEPLDTLRTPSAQPTECPVPWLIEATQNTLLVGFQLPYDNGDLCTQAEVQWDRIAGPMDRHIALGGHVAPEVKEANKDQAQQGSTRVDLPPDIERAEPEGFGGKHQALLTGLQPGTEYDVQVLVSNSYGDGPFSIALRMISLPGKPDAPGKMRHVNEQAAGGLKDGDPALSKGENKSLELQPPNVGDDDELFLGGGMDDELNMAGADDLHKSISRGISIGDEVPELKELTKKNTGAGQSSSGMLDQGGALFFRRTSKLEKDEVISVKPSSEKKSRTTIFNRLASFKRASVAPM
eukprot:TRINITY_DN31720_c0_g1_i1.p1 TRINITY_DN31720_c0_g1~~TRINITY_DN31720_c0_g1_i1.p1  ORF type:complete len:1739 (+),score=253.86 TRINITY_DN31720_c0_g1_i1:410-5218(+)